MKRAIYITAFLSAWVLLKSCSEETLILGPEKGDATITLTFPTSRGFGVPENAFDSLRIIIFKSNDLGAMTGTPVANRIVYPIAPNDDVIEITQLVPVGHINIYLIGNEVPEMNLEAITSFSDLQSVVLDYGVRALDYLNPLTSFPAYSGYRAVRVDATGGVDRKSVV